MSTLDHLERRAAETPTGDRRDEAAGPGRRAADTLGAMVDGVTDYAVFMLNRDGYVLTWNAGAERIKGYASTEVVGRHFSVFYPEADVAAGLPERQLEEAAIYGGLQEEGWRLRQDGSRFWASVSMTPLWTATRRLRGFAVMVRDDTDRRRVAQARARLALLEERERIARDLHDDVIQQLFSLGLSLRGTLSLAGRDGLGSRLDAHIDGVDRLIRHIWAGLTIPDMGGSEALPLNRAATPGTKVVVVTGATGREAAGRNVPRPASVLPVEGSWDETVEPLTDREREVLAYLATHLSLLDIARALFVSRNTVKTHVRAVYRKLGVSSRRAAVERSREVGLFLSA